MRISDWSSDVCSSDLRYRRFIAANGIGISGIEFITDGNGELYTYDVNTNTNYNSDAEAAAGLYGMQAIARYMGQELHGLRAMQARPEPVQIGRAAVRERGGQYV